MHKTLSLGFTRAETEDFNKKNFLQPKMGVIHQGEGVIHQALQYTANIENLDHFDHARWGSRLNQDEIKLSI